MAEREDIRERTKKLNPRLLPLCDAIDEASRESGYKGVTVTTTEDMTEDEEEMALFEGFLKEGHPPDVAAIKAKQFLARMRELF